MFFDADYADFNIERFEIERLRSLDTDYADFKDKKLLTYFLSNDSGTFK